MTKFRHPLKSLHPPVMFSEQSLYNVTAHFTWPSLLNVHVHKVRTAPLGFMECCFLFHFAAAVVRFGAVDYVLYGCIFISL